MRFLPLFFDLSKGRVALVGEGPAAANKLRLLRAAGAQVHWFMSNSDDVAATLATCEGADEVELDAADPLKVSFAGFAAVVSAAGRPLDDEVAARARAAGIPVNVVDRLDLSTFIFPAIINRGDVVVAIGTGGTSPVLARRLREQIEALLPARVGDLAALVGRYRKRFAQVRHASQSLRGFWERIIDGPVGHAALAGRWHEAELALRAAVEASRHPERQAGTVYLVGAGPGDPDLLTLRALHVMQGADIVFYDDLVSSEILDRVRRDAERVFVGKRRGQPGMAQDMINQRMAEAAQAGQTVVRLKSGDPFVFGRGGEELDYLRAQNVPAIVVPGVTAAIGCAAEAGLPLTYRGEADRLTFITAHRAEDAAATSWSGLADQQTTVVVYMGLTAAGGVRDGLIAAGRDPQTPVSILARGTRPDSAVIVGRLHELPELARQIAKGPALLVIGQVVVHSDAWAGIAQALGKEVAA